MKRPHDRGAFFIDLLILLIQLYSVSFDQCFEITFRVAYNIENYGFFSIF